MLIIVCRHTDDITPSNVLGEREMKTFKIPSFAELLDDAAPEPQRYVYSKTYEEIKDAPLAIMHTSGSTGMPKPRFLSTEWCNMGIRQAFLPPVNGKAVTMGFMIRKGRCYIGVPPWHTAGLVMAGLSASVIGSMTCVYGPTNRPPFGDVAMEVFKNTKLDLMIVKYFCP